MPYIDKDFLDKLANVRPEPVVVPISEGEERAFLKIQRLCGVRERCASELRDRLLRDGFARPDAEAAIARAVKCGLVDDLRYADVLVRSRISQGKGRAGIASELDRAGIDVCSLPGWPEEYFDDEALPELERALEMLRRKPPRAKDVRAAAFRRLVSKGYGQDVAYSAARRYAEERRDS